MEQSLTIMLLKSIASLAGVLALFAVFVWAMKRFQNHTLSSNHTSNNMRVLQRLSLDSRHSLIEVQRGTKHYILSTSSVAGVNVIETFDEALLEASKSISHVSND